MAVHVFRLQSECERAEAEYNHSPFGDHHKAELLQDPEASPGQSGIFSLSRLTLRAARTKELFILWRIQSASSLSTQQQMVQFAQLARKGARILQCPVFD